MVPIFISLINYKVPNDHDLMTAGDELAALSPQGGYMSLDRARATAPKIIDWKLRFSLGDNVPFFNEQLTKLTTHLPTPRD